MVLYEVHRSTLQRAPARVRVPNRPADRLRQAVPRASQPLEDNDEPARRLLNSNPDIARSIRALLGISITAAIVAIMIRLAPAEGGAVAVFAFAAALVRAASA